MARPKKIENFTVEAIEDNGKIVSITITPTFQNLDEVHNIFVLTLEDGKIIKNGINKILREAKKQA